MTESKMCNKCSTIKVVNDFGKSKQTKDGLKYQCKVCTNEYRYAWAKSNLEQNKAYNVRWHKDSRLKEGYGCYEVVYPSGRYIGSGQLCERRKKHFNGTSAVARKLQEKAVSFNILFKGTQEESILKEQNVVDNIGLDNLLNSIYPRNLLQSNPYMKEVHERKAYNLQSVISNFGVEGIKVSERILKET